MNENDSHFWVRDIAVRLPVDLLPEQPSWDNLLLAVEQLAEQKERIDYLDGVIRETLEDNLDLADGDDCTLIKLKRAIGYT